MYRGKRTLVMHITRALFHAVKVYRAEFGKLFFGE
jgi:hypothetical protein